jgi:glycosyltransferase involved in cell wall biosynthesis
MSNKRALLLCSVMMRGFGVSIVAEELAKNMPQYGWDLYVGAMRVDGNFGAINTFLIAPDAQEILKFCRDWKIDVVLAQTTPYFEVLPQLAEQIPVIVYEHGDPTPAFFAGDGEERERIRLNKIQNVYSHVNRVLASSYFLVQDISWPDAQVVTLGCDHVPDLGLKPEKEAKSRAGSALKVGTLMRLGPGEAQYKGNAIFRQLVEQLRSSNSAIEFYVMGRGTLADGDEWRSVGIEPILNAPDDEKAKYLRGLDVFVSPSMWEGFNLPIVEAQALGTVGIGFDTGAHPETALHFASSINDATSMIEHWNSDRAHLALACKRAYKYVRTQFLWSLTAEGIVQHCEEVLAEQISKSHEVGALNTSKMDHERPVSNIGTLRRATRLLKREGVSGIKRVIKSKL